MTTRASKRQKHRSLSRSKRSPYRANTSLTASDSSFQSSQEHIEVNWYSSPQATLTQVTNAGAGDYDDGREEAIKRLAASAPSSDPLPSPPRLLGLREYGRTGGIVLRTSSGLLPRHEKATNYRKSKAQKMDMMELLNKLVPSSKSDEEEKSAEVAENNEVKSSISSANMNHGEENPNSAPLFTQEDMVNGTLLLFNTQTQRTPSPSGKSTGFSPGSEKSPASQRNQQGPRLIRKQDGSPLVPSLELVKSPRVSREDSSCEDLWNDDDEDEEALLRASQIDVPWTPKRRESTPRGNSKGGRFAPVVEGMSPILPKQQKNESDVSQSKPVPFGSYISKETQQSTCSAKARSTTSQMSQKSHSVQQPICAGKTTCQVPPNQAAKNCRNVTMAPPKTQKITTFTANKMPQRANGVQQHNFSAKPAALVPRRQGSGNLTGVPPLSRNATMMPLTVKNVGPGPACSFPQDYVPRKPTATIIRPNMLPNAQNTRPESAKLGHGSAPRKPTATIVRPSKPSGDSKMFPKQVPADQSRNKFNFRNTTSQNNIRSQPVSAMIKPSSNNRTLQPSTSTAAPQDTKSGSMSVTAQSSYNVKPAPAPVTVQPTRVMNNNVKSKSATMKKCVQAIPKTPPKTAALKNRLDSPSVSNTSASRELLLALAEPDDYLDSQVMPALQETTGSQSAAQDNDEVEQDSLLDDPQLLAFLDDVEKTQYCQTSGGSSSSDSCSTNAIQQGKTTAHVNTRNDQTTRTDQSGGPTKRPEVQSAQSNRPCVNSIGYQIKTQNTTVRSSETEAKRPKINALSNDTLYTKVKTQINRPIPKSSPQYVGARLQLSDSNSTTNSNRLHSPANALRPSCPVSALTATKAATQSSSGHFNSTSTSSTGVKCSQAEIQRKREEAQRKRQEAQKRRMKLSTKHRKPAT